MDSHFCGKCAENLPSSEARLKKNRCGNCYDCPSCHQQLTTRAATVGPKNPEDPKATPRKVFYLLCLLCRWSSRDVGIPDQSAGMFCMFVSKEFLVNHYILFQLVVDGLKERIYMHTVYKKL